MSKEKSYTAKLFEQPLSALDGGIQDYKKAKEDICLLQIKKSETKKTLSEQEDAITKMEKDNLDTDIARVLIADDNYTYFNNEKYWRNRFLIGTIIPPALNAAYHYLSGQMPDSLDFNGLLEVAYGGGEVAASLSKGGSFVSFCEIIFFHGLGYNSRNYFEKYSGVDLTKKNAERVRERAEYIRKKLDEK